MEIAWFTETWLPTRDGVVTSLLLFKKQLEKRGHNIYIFAPGKENRRENNIIYYEMKTWKKYADYKFFPTTNTLFTAFKRTRKIINEIGANIIHSHSPGFIGINAITASKYAPLAFTFHTFIDESVYFAFKNENLQEIAKKAIRKWLKFYFSKCSCVIAPSQYVASRLKDLTDKEIKILPTGIEIERFRKGNGKRIKEKFGNKKIILHVGRIVKEKNVHLLIESAPYILKKVDAIFIIVGKGPAKNELEELVRKKGLENHFIFTGFVKDEELPDYYKAGDVFAFPSTYETQGIVALEAMASGMPVVAAKAKAIPEFVKDGENGYLFKPNDAKELAEKILMAIENKELGKKAFEYAKRYSIEKMAEKLIKIYEEMEDENKRKGVY